MKKIDGSNVDHFAIAKQKASSIANNVSTEIIVGQKIRELRNRRDLSLKRLSERSGLNINTLSLIENGKISPSVGTLQQLALALEVPITTFFESEPISKEVVFTPAGNRPRSTFASATMENLGMNLAGNAVQPFVVTLEPGTGSGEQIIVHTGYEFVYCLHGQVHYSINKVDYLMNEGDSLLFEAHLPHCWNNSSRQETQLILVLVPAEQKDEATSRHFSKQG